MDNAQNSTFEKIDKSKVNIHEFTGKSYDPILTE